MTIVGSPRQRPAVGSAVSAAPLSVQATRASGARRLPAEAERASMAPCSLSGRTEGGPPTGMSAAGDRTGRPPELLPVPRVRVLEVRVAALQPPRRREAERHE